ncbi:S-layer homology domain-containing protein [Bacillus songklensis]|uniref:S-layer homology domain-containing protein n=1 Tax=Bacillus songklensis TaxID=1069116 RepID=A0ABV8B7E9_9BACI
MKKIAISVLAASVCMGSAVIPSMIHAQSNVTVPVQQSTYEKLSYAKKKELLTQAGIKYGIPPEILKGIAMAETDMNQFNADGTPKITEDGGIGMMQITASEQELSSMLKEPVDMDRLKVDTAYNIDIGARILKVKWNYNSIPKINDANPMILENWYFAVMAYNGLSKRNDPHFSEKTYQDKVFGYIRDLSFADLKPFPPFTVEYPDPAKPSLMKFPQDKLHYEWPELNTPSTQAYKAGDMVYTFNRQLNVSNLRNGVDGGEIGKLRHYTPLQIVAGPFEKEQNGQFSHYSMYKVKGNGVEGYIASSNVLHAPVEVFSDLKAGEETTSAVAYLQSKGVLDGYPDGTYKPNKELTRRQAAKLLANELGYTLPEGYQVKSSDIDPNDEFYEQMAISEAHGIMGKGGAFRPHEKLTRQQMAAILARSYVKLYKPAATQYTFKDVNKSDYYYIDINLLANNGITVATEYFKPADNVTRAHFALFLSRTAELKE